MKTDVSKGRRYVYRIDGIPPSNNKYAGRENSWDYRRDKKMWGEIVFFSTTSNRPKAPLDKAIVILTYHFPTKGRRDPDNYSGKFLLDGLRQSGVITDDSFDHISLFLTKGEPNKKPYVQIEVIEVLTGGEE